MLKYIELKSGHAHNGPAWIANVTMSKTARTVYFNGRALKGANGQAVAGNYFDIETGEEFWVSGVKKDGQHRHWAGSGKILIEASVVTEYLSAIGATKLNTKKFSIFLPVEPSDISRLHKIENTKLR